MTIATAAIILSAGAAVPVVAAQSVAVGTATGTGAVTTAAVGGATASASAATGTAVSIGLSIGPIGWLALGTEQDKQSGDLTQDCWKPLLHDESLEPSNGKLLKDVLSDPLIKDVIINRNDSSTLPEIILHNVWGEQFTIQYVLLPSNNKMYLHALRI